jgi:hypothetical protein
MQRGRAAPQSDRVSHNLPELADGARRGPGGGGNPWHGMWVDYATFQGAPLAPPHIWEAGKTLESACLQRVNQHLKIFLTLE